MQERGVGDYNGFIDDNAISDGDNGLNFSVTGYSYPCSLWSMPSTHFSIKVKDQVCFLSPQTSKSSSSVMTFLQNASESFSLLPRCIAWVTWIYQTFIFKHWVEIPYYTPVPPPFCRNIWDQIYPKDSMSIPLTLYVQGSQHLTALCCCILAPITRRRSVYHPLSWIPWSCPWR